MPSLGDPRNLRSVMEGLEEVAMVSVSSVERERHRFSGVLQAALTKDEVVAAYIDSVRRVIEAEARGIYELDTTEGVVLDVRATVDSAMLEEYESYGRQDDPVLRFVVAHRRPIDSSRVVSADAWEACGARQA